MQRLNIDGVLFDLGSTLLEYETIPWSVLDVNCIDSGYRYLKSEDYKIPPVDEFWSRHVEIWDHHRQKSADTLKEWRITDAITELLDSFAIKCDGKLTDQFFDAYYAPISRQLSVFADAPMVLESLQSWGKKIGLVSNTYFPKDYHIRELRRFGLLHYFDFTIFSVNFGFRKPHPSIYSKASELLDIEPANTLFVGDRYIEDCRGPREFGMHAIIKYREGRDYPGSMDKNQIIIRSLAELLKYIAD